MGGSIALQLGGSFRGGLGSLGKGELEHGWETGLHGLHGFLIVNMKLLGFYVRDIRSFSGTK